MPLAALYSSNTPATVVAGQTWFYTVTVTNVGTKTWRATGTNRVRLGVYFAGDSDAISAAVKKPLKFALTRDVAPGKSFTLNVRLPFLKTPGDYILRHRLLKEPGGWFGTMERIAITVRQ
jgi:hypothetical protein